MIAILLATYNGEKYLREQINSILSQTATNWTLYIHDDGSTDKTLEIINEFTGNHPNIIFLEDPTKHRGACNSFLWLLEKVNADYYMFCDQDDVWFSNKIEESFKAMKQLENDHVNLPALVFSDLSVTDEELNIIFNSMWESTRSNKVTFSEYILCAPCVTGCTMLINKAGKEVSLKYREYAFMHDSLIALCISYHGQMQAINRPLIYYRQHGDNTLGTRPYTSSLLYRIKNLKHIFSEARQYYNLSKVVTNISLPYFIYLRLKSIIKVRM